MTTAKWVRLPSRWIDEHRLTELTWKPGGRGSDNTAALMALTVIAHSADVEHGVARVTYDDLCNLTGLSRAKLSNGLEVLKSMEIIEPGPESARSTYRLCNFNSLSGWAKLPAKSMYASGRVSAFEDFKLRRVAELDALKLFFLFVARRDRATNLANIGYEKIKDYTGVKRERIKAAISILNSVPLVYVEHVPSKTSDVGIASAYRIVGIDPYNHMGTKGRDLAEPKQVLG